MILPVAVDTCWFKLVPSPEVPKEAPIPQISCIAKWSPNTNDLMTPGKNLRPIPWFKFCLLHMYWWSWIECNRQFSDFKHQASAKKTENEADSAPFEEVGDLNWHQRSVCWFRMSTTFWEVSMNSWAPQRCALIFKLERASAWVLSSKNQGQRGINRFPLPSSLKRVLSKVSYKTNLLNTRTINRLSNHSHVRNHRPTALTEDPLRFMASPGWTGCCRAPAGPGAEKGGQKYAKVPNEELSSFCVIPSIVWSILGGPKKNLSLVARNNNTDSQKKKLLHIFASVYLWNLWAVLHRENHHFEQRRMSCLRSISMDKEFCLKSAAGRLMCMFDQQRPDTFHHSAVCPVWTWQGGCRDATCQAFGSILPRNGWATCIHYGVLCLEVSAPSLIQISEDYFSSW